MPASAWANWRMRFCCTTARSICAWMILSPGWSTKQPYLVRRARGYAPDPILLPLSTAPTLATGAELKNTFCLTREGYAFLSHHIGDLENYETLRSFEEGIRHFERLFRVQPQRIACDLHPDYLATRYAQQRAQLEDLPSSLCSITTRTWQPAWRIMAGLWIQRTPSL